MFTKSSIAFFVFCMTVASCRTAEHQTSSVASFSGPQDTCYSTTAPGDENFIFCTMHANGGTSLAMLQQDDFENRSNTGMALVWCDLSTQDTVVSNTRTLTFDDEFIKSLKLVSNDGFQTGKAEMISDTPHQNLQFKQLPADDVQAAKWVWSDESCVER